MNMPSLCPAHHLCSSQVTSCCASPSRAHKTPVTLVLFPLLPATARARRTPIFCVYIAWKSDTFCLDYVPFAAFTDVPLQSPRAS